MTELPLFGGYEPPPRPEGPKLSADQRRTARQAQNVAAGVHPLTGGPLHPLADRAASRDDAKDLPYRCGSCRFRRTTGHGRHSWPKCFWTGTYGPEQLRILGYPHVSFSAATDVRAWWPACVDYSPGDSLSEDAARYIPGEGDCG